MNGVSTYQLTWIRPQTNRVLFEFGVSMMPANNILHPLDAETQRMHGTGREGLNARTDLPSIFEGTNLTMHRNMGYFFNGTDVHFSTQNTGVRGSVSYVTGSHNLKFGMSSTWKNQTESYRSDNNWTNMLTIAGLPLQALFESRPARDQRVDQYRALRAGPVDHRPADDQRRPAVRLLQRLYPYFNGSYPDHMSAPGASTNSIWVPQGSSFPGATAAIWKDLQPRLGVVYDVTGDGRTALKASASRFGSRDAIALAGELNPAANNRRQTRLWLDGANSHFAAGPFMFPSCIPSAADPTASSCIPGDGLPQGDPLNPFPNGELMTPSDNPAFGTPTVTEFFDPNWAMGWGQKAANWEYALSVEHQIVDNVSVDVGYFRRHFINFDEWDNRNVGPADFDYYTITVPADERLPGGGNYPLTLVDMKPDAFNRVQDNQKTGADNLGGERAVWHGVDLNLSARLEGILLQGGLALGQRTTDFCGLQEQLPEAVFGSPTTYTASRVEGTAGSRGNLLATDFCRAEHNWLTNMSLFGSYTFPYDVEVSASFFSRPGTVREAIYIVPAADVVAALGRPATVGRSVSMNVIPPGTMYGRPGKSARHAVRQDPRFRRQREPAGQLRPLQPVQRQRGRAGAVRVSAGRGHVGSLADAARHPARPDGQVDVPVQLLALETPVRVGTAIRPRAHRTLLPSAAVPPCAARRAVRYSGAAARSRRIQGGGRRCARSSSSSSCCWPRRPPRTPA